ncbi:MAG: AAC(3) family N-acetyltransferase [Deltaproteobacteria bacterium]|nr:AAC(3) family N-acetyltransferase [Candidatus Zymogenaceae bacterium]
MVSTTLNHETFKNALQALGVAAGDAYLVHSGLRMMGRVDGGADTIIDTLKEMVTARGVIMMPAFTLPPAEVFEARETPATLGIICETFRKQDDVIRSIHPSHSVAVWGRDAQMYADAHKNATALGVGSPIHRIIEDGGDILLLGVGHWANSAVHVAEAVARVPYLDLPYNDDYAKDLMMRLPDGSITQVPPRENPGCSINFIAVEQPLKEAGLITYHRVGNVLLQRIDGRGALTLIAGLLKREPNALLCSWELCPFCPRARKLIP